MYRRDWIAHATALAAGLMLPTLAWSQVRWSGQPFASGVASGSPTHESVVLWTRLQDPRFRTTTGQGAGTLEVRWELAHDAQFKQLVQTGKAVASAALGYSAHVEVNGLESDRWFFYRFMVADAVSPVGRTRTFPAPGAQVSRVRLAYASCQRWEHGFYSAYRHMFLEQLDAVLFLGDYIYEYPGALDAVRKVSGGWVESLDDYRARYALHKSDPDLQAMHAACPWLVTWDDHEVQNDYAGLQAGDSGLPLVNFADRRAAAYQAYFENMPLHSRVLTQGLAGMAAGAEMRIYGSVPYGRLTTIYLLDDRQYRDPQACTKGGRLGAGAVNPAYCDIWNDPARTLLGVGQERWLDQAFAMGSRGWNVLGQQTVFGQRDYRPGAGQSLPNDGWDGYPAARTRLLQSAQRHRLANPVILGGDVHANWVGHVKADYARPDSPSLGVEFCGTSISSRAGSNEKMPERLAENPHFVFADAERRGYGVVELTPTQLTTTLRVVDDVRRQDSGISTLAQFVVAAGRPVIERVA
ncbi:MAG: alkaline phosphatase D family protein [Rhodoferax sp.]|nr:alkaline phosphatase D family protein [Rhodoferax sp.]